MPPRPKKPSPKKPSPKKPSPKKAIPKKAIPKKVSRICKLCGTIEQCPEGGLPPGWSISVEERGVEYMCGDCARRNIRAIEGKLPQEWWE